MAFSIGFWEADYQHDRRAHRHRCRCCRKIIEQGERVFMARVANRKTWAIHKEPCGSVRHSDQHTYAEILKVWAFEHQIKCAGLSETNPRHYATIEKYRNETLAAA